MRSTACSGVGRSDTWGRGGLRTMSTFPSAATRAMCGPYCAAALSRIPATCRATARRLRFLAPMPLPPAQGPLCTVARGESNPTGPLRAPHPQVRAARTLTAPVFGECQGQATANHRPPLARRERDRPRTALPASPLARCADFCTRVSSRAPNLPGVFAAVTRGRGPNRRPCLPACACRRTGHSLAIDESSLYRSSAGTGPCGRRSLPCDPPLCGGVGTSRPRNQENVYFCWSEAISYSLGQQSTTL